MDDIVYLEYVFHACALLAGGNDYDTVSVESLPPSTPAPLSHTHAPLLPRAYMRL